MEIDPRVRAVLCGLLLAASVAACVGAPAPSPEGGSAVSGSPPHGSATPAPSIVSEDAAVAAVQAFVGQSIALTATGPEALGIGMLYRIDGADVNASVDARSGRVVSLLLLGKTPGKTRALTDDEALAAAQKYLADHGVSVAGMRSRVEWMDHGDVANYRLTWQLYQDEIQMPEQTTVELDGVTGEVFDFTDYRTPHGPAPEPTVSRARAETAALALGCARNPGVTSADLVFTRPMSPAGLDPNAALVLVWSIAVDTTLQADEGCIVWVNALSGDAQVIAVH